MSSNKSECAVNNENLQKLPYNSKTGYIKLEELSPDDFECLKIHSGVNSLGRKQKLFYIIIHTSSEGSIIGLKFVVIL